VNERSVKPAVEERRVRPGWRAASGVGAVGLLGAVGWVASTAMAAALSWPVAIALMVLGAVAAFSLGHTALTGHRPVLLDGVVDALSYWS
jgi:uncharacterized membrane protein YGL010W